MTSLIIPLNGYRPTTYTGDKLLISCEIAVAVSGASSTKQVDAVLAEVDSMAKVDKFIYNEHECITLIRGILAD